MRITKKAVFDIGTSALLSWEGYDYDGPVEHCKGADVANAQRQQELDMQKQAFAAQQTQLKSLSDNFSKYLTQNIGFDPQQKAALTSSALDANAQQFQDAGQATREALLARGSGDGTAPAGGDYGRQLSTLLGAAAASKASTLNGINLADAQQATNNRFNAGSILSGNAATLNGTQSAAGSGASSALNSYLQAKNTGFASTFLNTLGGTLGKAVGTAAAGGGGFGLGG